jgi:hypothetical protein
MLILLLHPSPQLILPSGILSPALLGTVENKLPDISEKFGELKNWRQISFVIIAAIAAWFVRGGKF